MTEGLRSWADFVLVLLAMLVLWQAASWYAGDASLASPVTTMRTLVAQLQTGAFWEHVGATMEALFLSLAIGLVGGLVIGILFGLSVRAGIIAEPILTSLYSLPKVTLYPLVLLIFGLGVSAKVAYGVMHGIIPVILIVMTSIRHLKPVYLRTARVLRLSKFDVIRTLVIPATTPDLLTAVRLGFSLSLLGVLIGEMFASKRGLGFLVMNAVEFSNVPLILSVIVFLFAFAMSINGILLWLAQVASRR
jgi:NitT/TauT family transport system permease protein